MSEKSSKADRASHSFNCDSWEDIVGPPAREEISWEDVLVDGQLFLSQAEEAQKTGVRSEIVYSLNILAHSIAAFCDAKTIDPSPLFDVVRWAKNQCYVGVDRNSLRQLAVSITRAKGTIDRLKDAAKWAKVESDPVEQVRHIEPPASDEERPPAEIAAATLPASSEKDGRWSQPDSPSRWAKVFNMSPATFKRHVKGGKIRVDKLSDRSYRVHVDCLPQPQPAPASGHK